MYTFIPVWFTTKQKTSPKKYIDATILFGNPAIAFTLQSQLVKHIEYGAAFSALCLSIFYFILCHYFYRKEGDYTNKTLMESFLALGIISITIAIPLAFDGNITASIWALEAAGIYWLSIKNQRKTSRLFSSVLLLLSSLSFIFAHKTSVFSIPMINSFYFSCIFLSFSFLFISFLSERNEQQLTKHESQLPISFFVIGNLWWICGGFIEIESHLTSWWQNSRFVNSYPDISISYYTRNLSSLYIGTGVFLCAILGKKLNWKNLSQTGLLNAVFMAAFLLRIYFDHNSFPFEYGGLFLWPLLIGMGYWALLISERNSSISKGYIRYGHLGTLWVLTLVGSWEMGRILEQSIAEGESWKSVGHGIVLTGIPLLIIFRPHLLSWPIKKFLNTYRIFGLAPIIFALLIWLLTSNFTSGGTKPLIYIPILNPLEVIHLIFLVILPFWIFKIIKFEAIKKHHIILALGALYFIWLNGVMLRAIHHFTGIAFGAKTLFQSPLVQMSLSIYWASIGIALVLFSNKKNIRWLWGLGLGLISTVVLKLFLVDLSNSGTVERIISFISVGLVLLLIGYWAPIPPRLELKSSKE